MNVYTNSLVTKSLLIAGTVILLSACSSRKEAHTETKTSTIPDSIISVKTELPSVGGASVLAMSGQIESVTSATISTRVMGFITRITVKVGDHVQKGQLLVSISDQDILAKKAQANAALEAAQANLKSVQKDNDRFTKLYQQQSATAKELDNIALQLSAARATLEAARQQVNEVQASLAYASLRAPFSGIITKKMTEAGSMASPGMPILVMEQNGAYQVSASVPEREIGQLRLGKTATVTIRAINKTLHGTISQISPSSAENGGQYVVKLALPEHENQGLYAGMYVNVTLPVQGTVAAASDQDAILVPSSSIVHQDQLSGIYTINNNQALLRWVRLGKSVGDKIEVLSGLTRQESFISSASGRLYNGAPVKIQ